VRIEVGIGIDIGSIGDNLDTVPDLDVDRAAPQKTWRLR